MLGTLGNRHDMDEHKHGEDDEVRGYQGFRQALSQSRASSLKRLSRPKLRPPQRRGNSPKPFFASGNLMTCSCMPSSRAACAAASPV